MSHLPHRTRTKRRRAAQKARIFRHPRPEARVAAENVSALEAALKGVGPYALSSKVHIIEQVAKSVSMSICKRRYGRRERGLRCCGCRRNGALRWPTVPTRLEHDPAFCRRRRPVRRKLLTAGDV